MTRPAPPPHLLLRTTGEGVQAPAVVWLPRGGGIYWDRVGRWSATWPELDAGEYGPVELLITVQYPPDGGDHPHPCTCPFCPRDEADRG